MTKTKSQKRRAKSARKKQTPVKVNRANRRKAVMVRRTVTSTVLSKCASDYLRAMENPFDGSVACVPSQFGAPSTKENLYVRGTFSTGTAGVGGITVNPLYCPWNDSNSLLGTGRAAVISTTAAYAGLDTPIYSDLDVVVARLNSNFSSVDGYANVRARVVGCGVRVKNVTPMLNRGGTLIGAEQPGHASTAGMTFDVISSIQTSQTGDTSGRWNSVVYHPCESDELDYYPGPTLGIGTNASPASLWLPSLCFLATAPASTPQTYEYEVRLIAEFIGSYCKSNTPVHSDMQGMSSVLNAHGTMDSRRPVVGDRVSVVQRQLLRAAYEAAQAVGKSVVAQGIGLIGQHLAGRNRPDRRLLPSVTDLDMLD